MELIPPDMVGDFYLLKRDQSMEGQEHTVNTPLHQDGHGCMGSFHTAIVGENLVNIFKLRQVNPLVYLDCWTSLGLNDGMLAMDKPHTLL